MGPFLSLVGAPETDDANTCASRCDNRRMQAAVDVRQDSESLLTVASPSVLDGQGGVEVDVTESLEADAPLSDVPGAFVSSNSSNTIISYRRLNQKPGRQARFWTTFLLWPSVMIMLINNEQSEIVNVESDVFPAGVARPRRPPAMNTFSQYLE